MLKRFLVTSQDGSGLLLDHVRAADAQTALLAVSRARDLPLRDVLDAVTVRELRILADALEAGPDPPATEAGLRLALEGPYPSGCGACGLDAGFDVTEIWDAVAGNPSPVWVCRECGTHRAPLDTNPPV